MDDIEQRARELFAEEQDRVQALMPYGFDFLIEAEKEHYRTVARASLLDISNRGCENRSAS